MKVFLNSQRNFEQGLRQLEIFLSIKTENLHEHHVVNLLDYFYYKVLATQEHLFLVHELLHENVTSLALNDSRTVKSNLKLLAQQLARALQLLHSKHIVHNNLTTDNILTVKRAFRAPFEVRLIGLSCSHFADSAQAPTHYPPPESFSSVKGDIWALGALLLELCTGTPPVLSAFTDIPLCVIPVKTQEFHSLIDSLVQDAALAQFLKFLMKIEPSKRPPPQEILQHHWLSNL